jgi:hypothetical protein
MNTVGEPLARLYASCWGRIGIPRRLVVGPVAIDVPERADGGPVGTTRGLQPLETQRAAEEVGAIVLILRLALLDRADVGVDALQFLKPRACR